MTERLEDFALGKSTVAKGTIQKVGIIGAGYMGREIAILVSQSGLEVALIDLTDELVQESIRLIGEMLDERISGWGLTSSEKRLIMSKINGSVDYRILEDADIVIETINLRKRIIRLDLKEEIDARQQIFMNIEEVVRPDTVIVSNTATLLISEISSVLKRPERALGMHFYSPISKVKVVEVVRSVYTSDEAFNTLSKFALMIRRKLMQVSESAGNISTRMLVPMINEACDIWMEGVASVSEIDETMRETSGLQLGPFEMADKVGLDKLLKWMESLYIEYSAPRYQPSQIIKRMVRANMLGVTTGEGFYRYENGKRIPKTGTVHHLGRKS